MPEKKSQHTKQIDKYVIRSATWKKVHRFFFMNKLPTIKETLTSMEPERN